MKVLYIVKDLNDTAPNTVLLDVISGVESTFSIDVLVLDNDPQSRISSNITSLVDSVYYIVDDSRCRDFLRTQYKRYNIIQTNDYKSEKLIYFCGLKRKDILLITVLHSNRFEEIRARGFSFRVKLKLMCRLFIQRILQIRFDNIVCVSNDIRSSIFFPWLRNKSTVIYNGISLPKEYSNFRECSDGKLILCQVGHLCKLKNQKYSINLLSKLKKLFPELEVRLTLVGKLDDTEYTNDMMLLADQLGVKEEVDFLGSLSKEDVYKELAKSHIFIMPSRSEGLPLALLEAYSNGCKCIVSDVGGMPEVVRSLAFDGLVISKTTTDKDIADFVTNGQYFSEVITNFEKKYTTKVMVDNYNELYRKVLSK